jgi:DNA-binding transcriptional MerR regulator
VNDHDTQGFSGKQAADIVGISYRQLDYWARTDLIRPALADAQGSGTRRRYSYTNLLELRAVKSLLDAGIKLESVRAGFRYLREHLGRDIASVNLVISGKDSVLVQTDGELIDLLKRGQGVLNILPLAGVKGEVDAKIVELYPVDDGVDDGVIGTVDAPGAAAVDTAAHPGLIAAAE